MAEDKKFLQKLFDKLFKNKNKGDNSDDSVGKPTKWTPSYIAMTVIGILLCLVLIPIFVINVTITIKGAVNKDEVPTIFGVAPLIVLTGSMQPVILEGDVIFIKKTDVAALQLDDIIAFKVPADTQVGWAVVTHRIIDVKPENGANTYKTKGDYNFGDDSQIYGYINQDDIVGIYSGRVAKVGNFMRKMQEPIGMAIFIGIPVVLFIGLDVLRRYLYARKQVATEGDAQAELNAKTNELEAVKAELERLKAISDEGNKDNGDQPPQN